MHVQHLVLTGAYGVQSFTIQDRMHQDSTCYHRSEV